MVKGVESAVIDNSQGQFEVVAIGSETPRISLEVIDGMLCIVHHAAVNLNSSSASTTIEAV